MTQMQDIVTTGLLAGKRALVTGAGRGLGAAIAAGLARHGAEVIVTDVDHARARAQARTIVQAGGVAHDLALDVTDRAAVAHCAAQFNEDPAGLDILVNNAGVAGRARFDEPETVALWDRILRVNLEGVFNVSHALVPALRRARGSVVHLCSVAGFVAGGSTTGYVTSKGAIRSLTQVMARDLAPHGIRVNAVAPGLIKSEMGQAMADRPGGADWFTTRVPMARLGETDEVAGPVVFLASPLASFVTGVILPVDGGFLAA